MSQKSGLQIKVRFRRRQQTENLLQRKHKDQCVHRSFLNVPLENGFKNSSEVVYKTRKQKVRRKVALYQWPAS
jgi:hypothetical protein